MGVGLILQRLKVVVFKTRRVPLVRAVVAAAAADVAMPSGKPVERLRVVNIIVLALWAVLGLFALARDLAPGPWITAGLCVAGLYFFVAGTAARLMDPR